MMTNSRIQQLLSLIVKKLPSAINTCSITIMLSEGQVLLSIVIFSISFSLNAAHMHSHYATPHQQQFNKKAQKSKQDAQKHTEKCFPFLPFLCLCGPLVACLDLKKKPNKTTTPPKILQNSLLIFKGKYFFFPQKNKIPILSMRWLQPFEIKVGARCTQSGFHLAQCNTALCSNRDR